MSDDTAKVVARWADKIIPVAILALIGWGLSTLIGINDSLKKAVSVGREHRSVLADAVEHSLDMHEASFENMDAQADAIETIGREVLDDPKFKVKQQKKPMPKYRLRGAKPLREKMDE